MFAASEEGDGSSPWAISRPVARLSVYKADCLTSARQRILKLVIPFPELTDRQEENSYRLTDCSKVFLLALYREPRTLAPGGAEHDSCGRGPGLPGQPT